MTKIALGGLGDFLQVSSSAQKEKEIILYTHSGQAGIKYFTDLGVTIVRSELFWRVDDLPSLDIDWSNLLTRDYFDKTGCLKAFELSAEKEKYDLAIHPFGSYYSMHHDKVHAKNIGKNFSRDLIENILNLSTDKKTILLGTPQELVNYKDLRAKYGITIKETSIWDAIKICCEADSFIGADSFLKTVRGIYTDNKKQTIVAVESKADSFRDLNFINPYLDRINFVYYNSVEDLSYKIVEQIKAI